MYFKKSIFSSILFLAIIQSSHSTPEYVDFSGHWCWAKNSHVSTFSINIKKLSNGYKGGYNLVAYYGDKIDENENAFSFKQTKKNTIKAKIIAGYSNKIGLIQLKKINNKELEWLILHEPEGEFYAPHKATLYKCK